jgi:hypothetical protein
LLLTNSCKEKNDLNSSNKQIIESTDTLSLSKVKILFNSHALFDTTFIAVHSSMCQPPTSNIRFSNSKYNCTDSFDLFHRINNNDSLLYLSIKESIIDSNIIIDYDYMEKELKKYQVISKSIKSKWKIDETEIIIKEINGKKYGTFILTSSKKNTKTESVLTAYTIVDSKLLQFYFYSYSSNNSPNLTQFEKIMESMQIIKL